MNLHYFFFYFSSFQLGRLLFADGVLPSLDKNQLVHGTIFGLNKLPWSCPGDLPTLNSFQLSLFSTDIHGFVDVLVDP